jgi:hypothetical protein
VKNDLKERGNKYEILQFVGVQTKQIIGLEPPPPRVQARTVTQIEYHFSDRQLYLNLHFGI